MAGADLSAGMRVATSHGAGTVEYVARYSEPTLGRWRQAREVVKLLVSFDSGAQELVDADELQTRPRELRGHTGDGVIVSAIDLRSGKRRSWHEGGLEEEGRSAVGPLRCIVAKLRRLNESGAEWRILAISTPGTVFRDLDGPRLQVFRGEMRVVVPETQLLFRVGALDLLLPLAARTTPPLEPRQRFHRWRR
jgi:hypothetical protein